MAPGFVDTDMTRALPERREAILGEVPMGRMASPDEIAQTVVFLGAGAGYITRQVLGVNGGMHV